MPTFRQMSETVSPLARSRSASRSNRATSSAVLRLLMGPSVSQSTRRLPFRLDQFLGSRPMPPQIHPNPVALLPTERVTLDRFSDFWQHAREDLEAEVLFVPKSVGPSLDDADLVVDPFNEAQGHLVLLMAIRRDPVPVFLHHAGGLLVRLEALPPQGRLPSLEESPRPHLPLVVPQL